MKKLIALGFLISSYYGYSQSSSNCYKVKVNLIGDTAKVTCDQRGTETKIERKHFFCYSEKGNTDVVTEKFLFFNDVITVMKDSNESAEYNFSVESRDINQSICEDIVIPVKVEMKQSGSSSIADSRPQAPEEILHFVSKEDYLKLKKITILK